jgi:hypothetical protein
LGYYESDDFLGADGHYLLRVREKKNDIKSSLKGGFCENF